MTVVLKSKKLITAYLSNDGLFIGTDFFSEEEAIKLRDYLIANLPK